jgi:hypothetical protein
MRLAALLASVLVLGVLPGRTVIAQIQSGGPFVGSGMPAENAKDVRLKTAACNKAANKFKLRGDDRKKYLAACMAPRYSQDFKPPSWPLP